MHTRQTMKGVVKVMLYKLTEADILHLDEQKQAIDRGKIVYGVNATVNNSKPSGCSGDVLKVEKLIIIIIIIIITLYCL